MLIFGIALFGCFGQIRNSLQQQLMSSIEGVAEQNEILVEKEAGTRFRLLDSLARELSDGDESIFVDKMQGFVETYQSNGWDILRQMVQQKRRMDIG